MNTEKLWIRTEEVARLTGLNPGTLRTWRWLDARSGRGTTERPGRGGLVWRKFGRAVRYLVTSLEDAKEARDSAVTVCGEQERGS